MNEKKPIIKNISQQTFDELESYGHGVPRDKYREVQTNFSVGKEYVVKSPAGKTLHVRCTQNCPHHLKVISENENS